MNWTGSWALEGALSSFMRRRHPGFVSYTIGHKKSSRKREILLPIFDLQHLKGASDFEEVKVAVKGRPVRDRIAGRCPDTDPRFSSARNPAEEVSEE
jgi:hypothetical protein